MGPGIYDKEVFASSTIPHADSVFTWTMSPTKKQLDAVDEVFMEQTQTASFLVFKGNELIFEKYWGDHGANTVSNSFSAAKTFVALLVGVAVKEGKIKSLDDAVGNYLPEFNSAGKEKITIRHLLIMSSGLDWEESGKNPLSENAESYFGTDLYGLVTRQKAIETPGKRFNYQSGNSQLLGFIIEKATKTDLSKYAYDKIWSKIGTEHDAYWSLDKENGAEKAFCCLYGTSRDFGRLGKLIAQNGAWEGNEIIPAWYMEEMVKNPKMTTEEGVPNLRYGLHIWTYYGGKNPVYYCRGILGQYILSIPAEELVIVRTGSKRNPNFVIPEKSKNDAAYIAKNQYKVGHPTDIFRYLAIARKMIKKQ
jgi:CubicO group peptidase (beta-lactamase class C family)